MADARNYDFKGPKAYDLSGEPSLGGNFTAVSSGYYLATYTQESRPYGSTTTNGHDRISFPYQIGPALNPELAGILDRDITRTENQGFDDKAGAHWTRMYHAHNYTPAMLAGAKNLVPEAGHFAMNPVTGQVNIVCIEYIAKEDDSVDGKADQYDRVKALPRAEWENRKAAYAIKKAGASAGAGSAQGSGHTAGQAQFGGGAPAQGGGFGGGAPAGGFGGGAVQGGFGTPAAAPAPGGFGAAPGGFGAPAGFGGGVPMNGAAGAAAAGSAQARLQALAAAAGGR